MLVPCVHASVHKHVCVHVPMEGHECQVHGCVHVCGRVLPGAGCGSENAPWSSCYIRVSPVLIWELKIARGPALSQRARGRRAAPPGTLTRLLPSPFLWPLPRLPVPASGSHELRHALCGQGSEGVGRCRGPAHVQALDATRPDKVKRGVGSAPPSAKASRADMSQHRGHWAAQA